MKEEEYISRRKQTIFLSSTEPAERKEKHSLKSNPCATYSSAAARGTWSKDSRSIFVRFSWSILVLIRVKKSLFIYTSKAIVLAALKYTCS